LLVTISPSSSESTAPYSLQGIASDPAYQVQLEEFARNPAVMIELSSRCNYHCDYCRSPISDRQKSVMDRKLFDHLLPQLKGLTQRRLRLHVDGEPMLHPEFRDIALAANREGFRLAIATNASRLNNDLLPIGMDLYIHLSSNPEEHGRRSPTPFEPYVERIRKYVAGWLENPSDQDITLKIFFNGRESTDAEVMRQRRQFALNFVASLGLDGSVSWLPGTWKPDFTVRNTSGRELRIYFQQTTEGGLYPDVSGFVRPCDLPKDRGFCDSAWKVLAIHSDGAVGFCCVDITGKTIFTDPEEIWEKPLAWIWQHHPKLVEARKQFLSGRVELPICQECLNTSPNREGYLFTEIFPGDPQG
jgi:MoaA/NifB/PqqE/SkfB family radical SAM enzyme